VKEAVAKLRTGATDTQALRGAYVLWLQRLALGARFRNTGWMIFPADAPVGPLHPRSAGDFLREARWRGWVEKADDGDYYISQKGHEALASYKAVYGDVEAYDRHHVVLAEPSNEG
jgi:hypothetical protein